MPQLDIERGFPLAWPTGRPRTAPQHRKTALFRDAGREMTPTTSFTRLRSQLDLMTLAGQNYRTTNVVLSTNIRYTLSGGRDQNISRRDPDDPGVALYFDLDGKPHVLACDRWLTIGDNTAAIAAHIDALRGQERWGVADLRQAFAGHIALPAPRPAIDPRTAGLGADARWWQVLGVAQTASRDVIDAVYRRLATKHHPDRGGDRAEWDRLQAAYDAAKVARP